MICATGTEFGIPSIVIIVSARFPITSSRPKNLAVAQIISPIVEDLITRSFVSVDWDRFSVASVFMFSNFSGIRIVQLVKRISRFDQSARMFFFGSMCMRIKIVFVIAFWISACSSGVPSIPLHSPSCRSWRQSVAMMCCCSCCSSLSFSKSLWDAVSASSASSSIAPSRNPGFFEPRS